VVIEPVRFTVAGPGGSSTKTITGTIDYGAPTGYIPVEVPAGANRITVTNSYDRRVGQS
jgi:hypothetical protein